MEVFGYIEEGSMEIVGSRVGGYRGVVMNKFADLISKYDHQLCVEMRETVSETGKTINEVGKDEATGILPREPDCFCNDEASKDQVHTLGCCGKKVHVNCLVAYIHTIPFCMFCSTSLFQSLESTMSQSSTLSKDNNGVDDGDVMMKDGDDKPPAEIPLCQVIPNGSVGDEAGGDVCDGGDGGDGRDANMTMEDIVRKEAREKKARMQTLSAEKEMKRRGDCLVAAGLGMGAVLTLKVDYRTHAHAEGLVVIVYKLNETSSALVCCESGVVTHDGSKGDYWVPSDKFVVSAGAGELAAIPKSLQNIRDAVVDGTYDYGAQLRISYSKLHAKIIGASSPCKRAMCSCKGGLCGNRCGCRKKKIECNSACVCSGNCSWKEDDEK
jgi:hypothetical protein